MVYKHFGLTIRILNNSHIPIFNILVIKYVFQHPIRFDVLSVVLLDINIKILGYYESYKQD